MPAPVPVFQEVFQRIGDLTRAAPLRRTAVRRLALLVTGLLAARHCAVPQIAAELLSLDLTRAQQVESIQRRLRRTLSDARLTGKVCYEPIVTHIIDWDALRAQGRPLVLIVDESSCRDQFHLFRIGLAYWGTALPVAWALWEQNVKQPDTAYWAQVDALLARVHQMIPPDVAVIVLADRAYDIPPFIDRIQKLGWHWIVRAKSASALCFRDRFGQEADLAGLVRWHLPTPGRRWKIRGQVFKKAGWRAASVVGVWAVGAKEPLVILSDLPARWDLLAWYRCRFWIEPSFRNEKSQGWHWEESQIRSCERHETLLVAFAWAALLAVCVGGQLAQERTTALTERDAPTPGLSVGIRRPQHARMSLFTLGLHHVRRLFYHGMSAHLTWRLLPLDLRTWTDQWVATQFHSFLFHPQTVRP